MSRPACLSLHPRANHAAPCSIVAVPIHPAKTFNGDGARVTAGENSPLRGSPGEISCASQVAKAVEEVRRKEARTDATAREQLAKTCWLWRKNPESWTEQEGRRGEQLSDKPLVTGLAYAMRLELQKAYATGSAAVARTRFLNWCHWVRTEAQVMAHGLLEPMHQAAEMGERHLEGILGHWQAGLTTAFLEGLNSLFSAVKRKARGYRSSEYQTAMLYFVAGKLQVPYYG